MENNEVKTATLIRTLDSSIGSRLYSLSKPVRYAPPTAKRDGLTNYVVIADDGDGIYVAPSNWGGFIINFMNLVDGVDGDSHEDILKQMGYILT
jgi:hypothetical protein